MCKKNTYDKFECFYILYSAIHDNDIADEIEPDILLHFSTTICKKAKDIKIDESCSLDLFVCFIKAEFFSFFLDNSLQDLFEYVDSLIIDLKDVLFRFFSPSLTKTSDNDGQLYLEF